MRNKLWILGLDSNGTDVAEYGLLKEYIDKGRWDVLAVTLHKLQQEAISKGKVIVTYSVYESGEPEPSVERIEKLKNSEI